ncbi:hypothetical protein GE09DRAFT_1044492 [Coniochaeta sp. 2T2.1]|nr:hypothetical protein GE09DRAFT_1044492 [Coniochaeta sp. 2T2.1]
MSTSLPDEPLHSPATDSTHAPEPAQTSDFSSGRRQYFVEGTLNGVHVEALPDTGADMCIVSPSIVSELSLSIVPGTERAMLLPNGKSVESPGMVRVLWTFSVEPTEHTLNCWVLPGCKHNLVLGNRFLRETQTLTKFASRIRSRLVDPPRGCLRSRGLLERAKQRLRGYLDGHITAALPDTGSDVMLVSREYARLIGVAVDANPSTWLAVEFADGTTAWTGGVARRVPWTVDGRETVRCDFHVLDDLCVDVVLSNEYLFETRAFSKHGDSLVDVGLEEGVSQLHQLTTLAVTSPDAFGAEMVRRELWRRDLIRDSIKALPEDRREAAAQEEAERKRRWDELRETHRLRWASAGPSTTMSTEGVADAGTVTPSDKPQASWKPLFKKKKKDHVSIPLAQLRRAEEEQPERAETGTAGMDSPENQPRTT